MGDFLFKLGPMPITLEPLDGSVTGTAAHTAGILYGFVTQEATFKAAAQRIPVVIKLATPRRDTRTEAAVLLELAKRPPAVCAALFYHHQPPPGSGEPEYLVLGTNPHTPVSSHV